MEDKSKNTDTVGDIRNILPEGSTPVKKRLAILLAGFRADLAAHPYLRGESRFGGKKRIGKLSFSLYRNRLPLMTGTVVACLVVLITVMFANHKPTWAEVEETFGTIEHCSITVYIRHSPHDPSALPTVAQYWFGSDRRARIHIGNHVVFYSKHTPVQSFDVQRRLRRYPMNVLGNFLRNFERARKDGSSDLRTIMDALTGAGLVDTTDLLISDAQVAKDLLVFDAPSSDRLWWLRAWALRESKLPIRILKWHQKNSRYIEMIFTYSQEQPAAFFDPDAFASVFEDPSVDSHRLLNMFLEDPGGRPFPTPGS